jgi:hypothetical protein
MALNELEVFGASGAECQMALKKKVPEFIEEYKEGPSLKEAAIALKLLTPEQFDHCVRPETMIEPKG